jgi:hypothetical protein
MKVKLQNVSQPDMHGWNHELVQLVTEWHNYYRYDTRAAHADIDYPPGSCRQKELGEG